MQKKRRKKLKKIVEIFVVAMVNGGAKVMEISKIDKRKAGIERNEKKTTTETKLKSLF